MSQTQLSRGQSLMKESVSQIWALRDDPSAGIKDGIHHVSELNFISTVLPLIVPAAKDSLASIM